MDMNFALILVVAFFITGICWVMYKLQVAVARKQVEFVGSLFPVIALVLVLRSFLFEPFKIPSGSMIPTLNIGDFILVNKFAYGLRLPVTGTKVVDIGEPQRGDVMVFMPPGIDKHYIKRVVGLPGDTVEVRNGVLFINGEEMAQKPHPEWVSRERSHLIQMEQLGDVEHAIRRGRVPGQWSVNYAQIIPEGYYCMLGDNRDNSKDSRDWGLLPEENIVGKAVAVWMHWDQFFSWPDFTEARSIQ